MRDKREGPRVLSNEDTPPADTTWGGTLGEQSGGSGGTDSLGLAISYSSVNEMRLNKPSG